MVEALQVKYPIIDWEIHSEGSRTYWKIIRVGGFTEAYQIFEDMLKGFDREDLVALWNLVKEKLSTIVPKEDKEKALWVELKRLFKPNAANVFWKLQRYMHAPLTWKLCTNCRVHHVSSTRRHDIFMLIEKDYPLSDSVMILMLSTKLQVDEDCEMARDLVMKIFMEANKPKSRRINVAGLSIPAVGSRLMLLSKADTAVDAEEDPFQGTHNQYGTIPERPFNKFTANKDNNFNKKVTTIRENITTAGPRAVGNPKFELQEKGVSDSGCSRHMTGNMSYLYEYEEIDGGYVAFGGDPKKGKITSKGKISTDYEEIDGGFVAFGGNSKRGKITGKDTKCVVLSPDFKLLDESQVLLRVPRKNNMYSVDLKNVAPSGDSDYPGCLDSCKSTFGGIQFLGGDKLVSWSSKKQDYTSMSSTEAKYVP
nr:hypothetical protein [Tanacetum cinerariifolium]